MNRNPDPHRPDLRGHERHSSQHAWCRGFPDPNPHNSNPNPNPNPGTMTLTVTDSCRYPYPYPYPYPDPVVNLSLSSHSCIFLLWKAFSVEQPITRMFYNEAGIGPGSGGNMIYEGGNDASSIITWVHDEALPERVVALTLNPALYLRLAKPKQVSPDPQPEL